MAAPLIPEAAPTSYYALILKRHSCRAFSQLSAQLSAECVAAIEHAVSKEVANIG